MALQRPAPDWIATDTSYFGYSCSCGYRLDIEQSDATSHEKAEEFRAHVAAKPDHQHLVSVRVPGWMSPPSPFKQRKAVAI